MKKLLCIFSTLAILASCTSDGKKVGVLQKVSHKNMCNYYVVEIAFEGGRATTNGSSTSYQNTQEYTVSKECADTIENYLGKRVVITYEDRAFTMCEESKLITAIKILP